MDKEQELKKLLAEERIRSFEWRKNFQSLKECHLTLQESYLESISEMKKVLEHAKQIKDQLEAKEREIESYSNELKDKDKLEEHYRKRCKLEIEEFSVRMKKELDHLKMDRMQLVSENEKLKQKNEHLDQEIEMRLRNQSLEHQNELNALQNEKDALRAEFREAKKHPDYEKLIKLTNENQDLKDQIDSVNLMIKEQDEKYRRIDDERDRLINEQNLKIKKLETKLANAEQDYERQKQENSVLKNEVKVQDNQLKQIRNSLEDERLARETLIEQHSNDMKRKQKEFDELKQKLNEEKLNNELEIDRLKQEKKKVKNDCEDAKNELRRLKDSIEQREKEFSKELAKSLQIEREKFNSLSKVKQVLNKEKEELEDNVRKLRDETDLKQNEINELMSIRLDMEKDQKQLKSQIVKLRSSECEMEKTKKELESIHDEFEKLRTEHTEVCALNKQLERENMSLNNQFTLYRAHVEEEKKQSYDYKQNCERNLSRIKNSFDLERNAFREEIDELKDVIRTEKHKRKEIKSKCVQYCEVAKRLHKHVKQIEDSKMTRLPVRAIKGPPSQSALSIRHNDSKQFNSESELRKQYKEMKKMLNEIQNSDYCKLHQPIK